MTSLLCVPRPGGQVAIHDRQLAETLTIGPDDVIETTFMPRAKSGNKSGRPKSSPSNQTTRQPSMDATSLIDGTMKMQDWLNEKSVMGLQKDMNSLLDREDFLNLRKRELLHKTWNDQVYEPIRRQICQKLEGQDWSEVNRRRRVLHKHYIEHINRRGHVYLDTMDNGEYYAQALNDDRPAPIPVYTPELRDPLLSQERERLREDQTILRCQTGNKYTLRDIRDIKLPPLPLVPLGRHGTSCQRWLKMPLGDIESTLRQTSRLRMQGRGTHSGLDFKKWAVMPFDARVVDKEMQTQKKRMFEEKPPYGIPPRQIPKAPFDAYNENNSKHELCVNT
ncbi:hypothetical protein BaRGS_00008581 [Batillaria attramentaria]|uniref:Protein FAM228B n=1 Tax=Batillaria attramentaria TaxID=370345 RepID=A0ABD0LM05_9CAEN